MHVLRYESLIGDFDLTVKSLLEFLGLGWDESVRDHTAMARERPIMTPSAPQVIRPIYNSSVGAWRHYGAQLQPHLPALDRWAVQFGYEASVRVW